MTNTQLKELIETYQNAHDDSDTDKLKQAFEMYCSEFDMREGYIHGLLETVNDQINNHTDDSEEDIQDIINLLK